MFNRITFDPDIMGGRACIRGMSLPVEQQPVPCFGVRTAEVETRSSALRSF